MNTDYMKFFVRSYHTGEYPENEQETVATAYLTHLETIKENLSENVYHYVKAISIHDGRFVKGYLEKGKQTLSLTFRCGDLQKGYFDITFTYTNVHITSGLQVLLSTLENAQSEILADEIDISWDNKLEHSIIFYPNQEISVRCTEFLYTIEPAESRVFKKSKFKVT